MSRRTGKHRIYMNVGYDLTEQQLRDFFNQYGTVTDVYLPKHKSGRNKGFGFTTFDSEEGLRSALSAQEYIIGGDVVKINRAGPRPEFEASLNEAEPAAAGASGDVINRQPQLFGKGPRLYVGGVPEELSEERLKAHFSRWGNVVDLYFPGKKGQSRVNYCFVTFDNWRAAQTACNQSERNIDGMPLQSINLAQERTAEQEQQAKAEAAAAAATAASASEPKIPSIAGTGGTPDFDVGELGSASNLAFIQHIQMQAQLQAQQSGYALQQQQAQLQSILSGQSMGILPPAAYPAAYQQVLNSLLAQQSGAGLGMPSPGLYQASSSGSLRGFDLPATPAGPYPQGLGSMPVDLGQLLAAQAQAADQHATSLHRHTQPAGIPDASQLPHGMPLGLGAAPSLQSTASADMAACLNPMGWGWGGSAGNALLADASRVKPLQPHPDLMLAQAQANARAAASAQSSNVGSVQLPYGVLSSEGFGPLRSIPGRHRNIHMPY
ncbi:hypothetical protein ABBQ38_000131 [Trebouxia sp. C0009 RCD-2024]